MKRKRVRNRNINIFTLIAIYLIFGLVFISLVIGSDAVTFKINDLFDINAKKVNNDLLSLMNDQNTTVNKIKEVSKNANYNFSNPYILVNPFGLNPCSALMIFTTEEPFKVTLEVNDKIIGESEATSIHYLPIYGLDENAYNHIILTLEDGSVHEELIKTDSFYSSVQPEKTDRASDSLLLSYFGSDSMSAIYGYNSYNNVNFVISGINYFNTFNLNDDSITLEYNSKKGLNTILVDIDFLGRIKKVYKKGSDYTSENNVFLKLYKDGLKDYDLSLGRNDESYTEYNKLDFDVVSDSLVKAPLYFKEFSVSLNESYLTYDINETGYLILVREDGILESFYIDDSKIIRIDPDYKYSLYLISDSTYYNLYTTLTR